MQPKLHSVQQYLRERVSHQHLQAGPALPVPVHGVPQLMCHLHDRLQLPVLLGRLHTQEQHVRDLVLDVQVLRHQLPGLPVLLLQLREVYILGLLRVLGALPAQQRSLRAQLPQLYILVFVPDLQPLSDFLPELLQSLPVHRLRSRLHPQKRSLHSQLDLRVLLQSVRIID